MKVFPSKRQMDVWSVLYDRHPCATHNTNSGYIYWIQDMIKGLMGSELKSEGDAYSPWYFEFRTEAEAVQFILTHSEEMHDATT